MLLSFTPNPCIERTLRAPEFARGARVRVPIFDVSVTAGGKGVNASRVAAKFGVSVRALVPVGSLEREFFAHHLAQDGVNSLLVETGIPTRTCINIVTGDAVSTEILEAGAAPPIEVGTRILNLWREELKTAKMALIGGSYPPAEDANWSAHATILCSLARAANVPLVFDGQGETLRRAVFSSAPPWGVKPNVSEAEALLNRELKSEAEKIEAVREIAARGVECVLLSDGENGLYLGWRGAISHLPAPRVEFVSSVGSGDALVGAFCAKALQTGDVNEAARWGVAAGALNATRFEAARVTPEDVAPLVEFVAPRVLSWGVAAK